VKMSVDVRDTLLEALASPAGTGALPKAQELLTQLGESDPTARLLAQFLGRRQTQELENETPSKEAETSERSQSFSVPDKAQVRSDEMSRAVHQLRRQIESMYRELAELRDRNDALAAAFGACYLCWGNDPDCEICNGHGRTGFAVPDKKLFAQFAAPAARRLKRKEEATQSFPKAADQCLSESQTSKPE
jgi:hypothetical protein